MKLPIPSKENNEAKKVRVCVPVCAKSFAELEQACARASESADIVELRLDCVESDGLVEEVRKLLARLSSAFILTYRPSEQGGYRVLSRAQREAFWSWDWGALCDVEWDLVDAISVDAARVIVSHHDFNGVPDDLEQIYERLAATSARVVKIAVQASDITDCLRVFHLLDRARREQRELIAIAMGNAGIVTRILGPARGAYLTYGSFEDKSATAPGQLNARQLRSLYHIDEIDDDTMICGLVGMPVMHSVSPHAHNAAFAAEGVNGVYLPLEVRDIATFVRRMVQPRTREFDWNLRGLSVTAPHKTSVMELLDWIHPTAKEIGAVNTVVVEGEKLLGYNTDADGVVEPLRRVVPALRGLRVAVIGAGGAARAVVWALQREHAHVTLFARDPGKGRLLGEIFGVSCESLASALFDGFDVVINATPQSPATAEQLAGAKLGYDLIYNPGETEFLKQARAAGCETLGGLPMLVAQARHQFELWTGKTPSTTLMHNAAAAALSELF